MANIKGEIHNIENNRVEKRKRSKIWFFCLARRKGGCHLRGKNVASLIANPFFQGFKSLITNKVKELSSKTTQFFYLARRKGFEPLAFGSVDRRYIQLS